ncbi:membrane protein insertase YidC [Butyricicoccus sp.]|uniref:membrane protein insertase YidC n=1 Tax=Butyricicoccus sp. TaxID=2049021 RepID=UPI003F144FAA
MGDFFGIIIVRPMGLILMAIWSLVHNYGLALILFTLVVKLILLPFMYKQKKSMKKMSLVQAESAAIQKRYAKNREKMNEEITKLYEREGVSPMGSCALSFITLPIMMALYYAVRQPMKYMMGLSTETMSKIAEAIGTTFDNTAISGQIELAKLVHENWDKVSSFASEGLVNIDFNFLGLDLSATPQFTQLNALWLIPILSGGTALLSSWIMRKMQNKANPAAQENASAQMNSTMNTMLIIMPLMSVWIAFTLPASMGVYWVVNNVFTCIQEVALTWYILKFDKADDDVKTKERKRREAAHKMRLEEQAEAKESGVEVEYRGAKSANVSKKKLKAREAEQQRIKDKETAARAAQIKAEKEAARRAGRQVDDE